MTKDNTITNTTTSTSTPSKKKTPLSSWQNAVSGATAGVVSRFVIAPFDVLKIRYQLQTNAVRGSTSMDVKYRGVWESLKTIHREEGIRGLWKGNLSAAYLYLSYGAIQFTSYYKLQRLFEPYVPHKAGRDFVSGATAGSIATIATYPFDLMRTRYAAQGQERILLSLRQAVHHIYENEGVTGFYKGLTPSVFQIIPYMGLMFWSYNQFQTLFDSTLNTTPFHPIAALLSGGAAGVTSKTIVMPLDLIRKRLQVQGPDRKHYVVTTNLYKTQLGMVKFVREVVAKEGVLALWKGWWTGMIKTGLSSAVTFATVEGCRRAFTAMKEEGL